MREFLILSLVFLLGANGAFAYDLVMPRDKKAYVNTNYQFFYGKARTTEAITINDEKVYVAPNGAFAHSIELKEGENRIVVRSNYGTRIYKIYKNSKTQAPKANLSEFEPKTFKVKKDNTPLRNTPIDFGMNRIAHLFEGTNLLIDGEKGDFYRVFLSKNKTAWIAKDSIEESSELESIPKFITMNSETFKNASNHIIEFSDKLPYTLEENNNEIIFKVYNPFISDNSVYTVNIKHPKKYAYTTMLRNGVYVFKVKELYQPQNRTLEGLNIIIDPGHGGSEKGAIGCLNDMEKDINLSIAQELKNILCLMGANVIMTRECDGTISLNDRIKIAKDNCADIFVSIHLNSIPDIKMDIHKNRGTSVYYYNPNSKDLARSIEDSLTKSISTKKDGVRTASFAVTRPSEYISVLVETAYMTNPLDSVIYKSEDFARKSAQGIADGIVNYVHGDNSKKLIKAND